MNMNPYKMIDENDIAALKQIFTAERVIPGADVPEDFCHDELSGTKHRPDVMVRAASAEEIAALMKYASANHIPVTPRGQGTGLVGGAVPMSGGILLDMSGMNRILELDEENMTLTVEPGVLLMEVAKFAEDHGLFYPPDPGEKTATIGGNISTNAGGMRAVKYGVTRDYVRGLDVVLPDGSMISPGGKIVKNSSGYSLKDLIVGSEGTLGIVTKAVLRLLPLPKYKISLLVPFADLTVAIRAVPAVIRASSSVPTAVEFMEREVILAAEQFLGRKFPDNTSDAYLLLTFDGAAKDEVERACDHAAQTCIDAGAIDVFISDSAERNESIWAARSAFLEAIKASTSEMDECDVVVPRRFVADLIDFTRELQKKYNIRIRSFGHAGDGNLHIYVLRDQLGGDDWNTTLNATFAELYGKARSLGGKVSGEHGIGYAKKSYLVESLSPEERALMKGIKQVFDPFSILNPGKVVE